MPLATNPRARFEVVLESDKGLPEDRRPKFIYRYLTGHQQKEIADIIDSIGRAKFGKEGIDRIFRAAKIGLIDWQNICNGDGKPVDFDPEKLEQILGMTEALEMAQKVLGQAPDFEDKKKLDSQSPSSTGQSAVDVPALKNAKTSQVQPSPSESGVPAAVVLDAELAKPAAESKSSSVRKR
ncbi:MAG TPA: hypothetical protein HPP87_04725 [Planctomycetes bacterium]|nr:hypothetical protein [Planctomycetota bacterium]